MEEAAVPEHDGVGVAREVEGQAAQGRAVEPTGEQARQRTPRDLAHGAGDEADEPDLFVRFRRRGGEGVDRREVDRLASAACAAGDSSHRVGVEGALVEAPRVLGGLPCGEQEPPSVE
jgi:hypothetical protein